MNAVSLGVQFNGIIAATATAIAQTKHTNIEEEEKTEHFGNNVLLLEWFCNDVEGNSIRQQIYTETEKERSINQKNKNN